MREKCITPRPRQSGLQDLQIHSRLYPTDTIGWVRTIPSISTTSHAQKVFEIYRTTKIEHICSCVVFVDLLQCSEKERGAGMKAMTSVVDKIVDGS
jgi:hypothetical protein